MASDGQLDASDGEKSRLPRLGSLMSKGKAKKNDWHNFASYCKEKSLLDVVFLKEDLTVEQLTELRLDALLAKFTDLLVKDDPHSKQVLETYEACDVHNQFRMSHSQLQT